jgi:hypothetical protein
MKIIADTNIWYYLGENIELFKEVENYNIFPTFANIYELSKSDNILNNENLSRLAIQRLFAFKTNVIYPPPFTFISILNNNFEFDTLNEIGDWLLFTEKFAKGHSIEPSKKEEFKIEIDKIRKDLQSGADIFNKEAEKFRSQILDNKKHKKENSIQSTSNFINYVVKTTSLNKYSLEGFDLNQIELLVRTLDHFFKTIETTKMKIHDNDWFDFAILAYIQPGDKFWTNDKKWIRLIKEAGCENYLLQEKNVLQSSRRLCS